MKRWRILGVSAAVLVLAGCGAGSQHCTLVDAPSGIGLEISETLSETATQVELEVCWDGDCINPALELMSSTVAEPQGCTGTGPDDSCSAEAVETGKKHGFAISDELPEAEIDVTVTLLDDAGSEVLHDSITITPEMVYPNGPQCGGAGVQAQLVMDESGLETAH